MTPLRRLLVLPALLLVLAAPAAGASQPTRGVVVIETALGYQQTSAAGTGFVLTSGGKVLTNNHVIRGATHIRVLVPGTGRRYSARVLGYAVTGDVAVLQLEGAAGIPTAQVGTSAGLQRGRAVIAVGNAGGARRLVTTRGTITALRQSITVRDDQGDAHRLTGLIQVNAELQPGDSGGPLLDRTGHVIGIDTAASVGFAFRAGDNQGYAIPIDRALAISRQIDSGRGTSRDPRRADGIPRHRCAPVRLLPQRLQPRGARRQRRRRRPRRSCRAPARPHHRRDRRNAREHARLDRAPDRAEEAGRHDPDHLDRADGRPQERHRPPGHRPSAVAADRVSQLTLRKPCFRRAAQSSTRDQGGSVPASTDDRSPSAPAEVKERLKQALYEIRRVIAGQDAMLERVLVCLLAQGHLLIEGVPGLAKTLTIKTTAAVLGGTFKRVQFTPDLVPSDLVGTRIYRANEGEFETEFGPVFCNFLLADEINRAPAKVQSALLEVMQERQVTIGHDTTPVPDPFLVMATQNPIESEGTYQLPEAQIDRFMLKILIGYPTRDEELTIVQRQLDYPPELREMITLEELRGLQDDVHTVYADPALIGYAISLADATRNPAQYGLEELAPYISYGASPRGPISLIVAARALALIHGRDFVTVDDVNALAADALRHRLVLSYQALAEEVTADSILERVQAAVPVPQLDLPETSAA